MIVIGVGVLAILALVLVLATKGGSSPSKGTTSNSAGTGTSTHTTTSAGHHKPAPKGSAKQVKATPPAETSVVVLNGTEQTGLAHLVSSQLQQSGYSQATALDGRPPGANEATVVEYAGGHQADASGVAKSLSVSHVEPMEQAVAVLAGSAKVVVVVGTDKATTTATP
jgi:LytR cell envelope-related transcriptional attenuator